MHAHEHGSRSTGQRGQRRRSSEPGEQHAAAARVLELQRTMGNAAVSAMFEEQRAVQRVLPGGQDQVEQDQAGGEQAGQAQARGAVAREQRMSARYGIRIGPPPGSRGLHFSNAMLDHIDAALQDLPLDDLGPNQYLVAIERVEGTESSASEYNPETSSVEIVRPVLPGGIRAPQWLYARLNRGNAWQRRRMDIGAMDGYQGVGRRNDRALGIGGRDRHVMGGVSDVLAHGNLVEWTVRHEVGHAVDLMEAWLTDFAHEDRFGGWRVYRDGMEIDEVAEAVLRHAGLNTVNPAGHAQAVATLSSLLRPRGARQNVAGDGSRLHNFLRRYQSHLSAAEFATRGDQVIRFVRLALAQPWTLDDGGSGTLDVNGRTYHVDHYDTWVSYVTAQRVHALSNYQFSTPAEWIAEAYAAYYDRDPGPRARLSPQVRAWFAARAQQNQPAAPGPAGPAGPAGPS